MIRKSKKQLKDSYTDLLLVNGVYPKIDNLTSEDKLIAYDLIKELVDCQITYFPEMEDFENEDNKEILTKKFLEIKDYYNESNYVQSLIEFAILEAFRGTSNMFIKTLNEMAKGDTQSVYEEMTKRDPNAPRQPWDDSKPKHYIFKFKDGTKIECHSVESKDAVKQEAIKVYKQMKDEEFEAEFAEINNPIETTELVEAEPTEQIDGIYELSDAKNILGLKADGDDLIYIPTGEVIYPNFRQFIPSGKIPYKQEVVIALNLADATGRSINNLDDAIWLTITVNDICDEAGLRMAFANNEEKEMVIRKSLEAERERARRENRPVIGQDSKVKDNNSTDSKKIKDFFEPIKSFKSWEFTKENNQGDEVVALYENGSEHSEDNRLMAICKRPEGKGLEGRPYLVAAGYSPDDGVWNQGYYDFETFEDAEKFLKENYKDKIIPFVIKDSVKAKDWNLPSFTTYETIQNLVKTDPNFIGVVQPYAEGTWDYDLIAYSGYADDYDSTEEMYGNWKSLEDGTYYFIHRIDELTRKELPNDYIGDYATEEEAAEAMIYEYNRNKQNGTPFVANLNK